MSGTDVSAWFSLNTLKLSAWLRLDGESTHVVKPAHVFVDMSSGDAVPVMSEHYGEAQGSDQEQVDIARGRVSSGNVADGYG